MARLLSLVSLLAATAVHADFFDEYLADKVFGDDPGPCPTEEDNCSGSWENLPESIKDINVDLFPGLPIGNVRIGDVLKAGTVEIWDLQCGGVGVDSIALDEVSTADTLLSSKLKLRGLGLRCTLRANLNEITLGNDDFSIVVSTERSALKIPNNKDEDPSARGFIDQTDVELRLSTDSANGETFATDLPNFVELPADSCEISTRLNMDLTMEQLSLFGICIPNNPIPFVPDCIDVINEDNSSWVNAILRVLGVDALLNVIIRIIEFVAGGIVCQVLEELAILSDPTRDGILNQELKRLKGIVDTEATRVPPINVVPFDQDEYVVGLVGEEKVANSINFATNAVAEAAFVGINNWLGSESTSPGYEGRLVVNELVDQLSPDKPGYFAVDLVELNLATTVEIPLNFTNLEVRVQKLALSGANTFETFKILENGYDQEDPTQRFRYTLQNEVLLGKVGFETEVYINLKPGNWVSSGTAEQDFTFTFSIELEDLYFNASALVLSNPDEVSSTQVGQLVQIAAAVLDPETGTDNLLELLSQALVCLAPALYALELSNLEAAVGAVLNPTMLNFDGSALSELIQDSIVFGSAASRGAFKEKLPGISRGIVRETINELAKTYITDSTATAADCPAYPGPEPGQGPIELPLSSSLFGSVGRAIDATIGGDPIRDTATDINELVDVLLSYYTNFEAFPLEKQDSAPQGAWHLTDNFRESLSLPAYKRPSDYIRLDDVELDNVNSIYKLRVQQPDSSNGLVLSLGFGGELAPGNEDPTVSTPFQVKVPVDIFSDVDGVSEAFDLSIALSDIDTVFDLDRVSLEPESTLLTLGELVNPTCLLSTLHSVALPEPTRELSLGGVSILVQRTREESEAGTSLDRALTKLVEEPNPVPGGRFETLINSLLRSGFNAALDRIEAVPSTLSATPSNCTEAESPFAIVGDLLGLSLPNFTAFAEECFADVDLTALPDTSVVEEEQVQYDENSGDTVFDLQSSVVLGVVSELLSSTLSGGGADDFLRRLANNTDDSFISSLFVFNPSDPSRTQVDLIVPLKTLGLSLESDAVLPGFVLDAGKLTVFGLNRILRQMTFLKPLGTFTTRHEVIFSDEAAFNVTLESFVEFDRDQVEEGAEGKIREEIDISFELTGFRFVMDIITALNPASVGVKSLGHFLTTNSAQTFELADTMLDCLADSFYKGGFYLPRLEVAITDLRSFSLTSRNNELLSDGAELVVEAVTDLATSFYQEAVTPVFQNCVRTYLNYYFAELQEKASCPDITAVPPPPLEGQDQIFRFDTSSDWAFVQSLLDLVVEDEYRSLNTVLEALLADQVLLKDAAGINDLPVIYAGRTYGAVDLGLSNVRLSNLVFEELALMRPAGKGAAAVAAGVTPEESSYVTETKLAIPGGTGKELELQFDLKLNARKLFTDIPDMKNDLRVSLLLSQISFDLLLLLEVNITEALQLQFDTVSSLEKLPCVLVPIDRLTPLSFDFSVGSLGLKAQCLDRCDLPMLTELNDFEYISENSEQLGGLFSRSIEFVTSYLGEINAQQLLDVQLDTAEETCDRLLELLDGILTPPSVPADVASPMGIAFVSVAGGALVLGLAGMYPLHRVRRKQRLLSKVAQNEKRFTGASGGEDLNMLVRVTELEMKSIFQHPATPVAVKYLVPVSALVIVVLVIVATLFSQLMNLVVQLMVFGAETVLWDIVPFTLPNLVNTLWAELGWFLGLLMAIACVGLPGLQTLTLLMLWFTPNTVVSLKTKRSTVFFLQAAGKLGFAFLFILANLQSSLFTRFTVEDYVNTQFVPASVLTFELNVTPERGVVLIVLAAVLAQVLAHTVAVYLEKTANYVKMKQDELDGKRGMAPTKALTVHRRLVKHTFMGRDDAGMTRKISPVGGMLLVGTTVLGALLTAVGVFLPAIQFEIQGVLGIILREVSRDSPTIKEALQFKPFSVVELGSSFSAAPVTVATDSLGNTFIQLVFFFTFVIVPIVQPLMLAGCYFAALRLRSLRRFVAIERTLLFWNNMDLALVVLVGMLFITAGIIEVYINYISEQVFGDDFCFGLEPLLLEVVPDETDAKCMTVAVTLLPSIAVLVLGFLMQTSCSVVFAYLGRAALADRYYAAYHPVRGDARPPRPSRIGLVVLKLFTTRVPAESPREGDAESYSMFDRRADEEGVAEPGCFSSCLSAYNCCSAPDDDALISQTERRVERWQRRFGGPEDDDGASRATSTRTSGNPLFSRRQQSRRVDSEAIGPPMVPPPTPPGTFNDDVEV